MLSVEELKALHPLLRDERNIMRTSSLFWEVRRDRTDEAVFKPIFSLKPEDHVVDGITFWSLKKVYFSYDHIPGFEYAFAMDVFGSWEHWIKLTKSSFRQEFQEWRDELEIKIKSEAIKRMLTASKSNDAKGVAAAKYIADKGYTELRKAGRPSKEEVEREKKIAAGVSNTLAMDMERIGLKVAK